MTSRVHRRLLAAVRVSTSALLALSIACQRDSVKARAPVAAVPSTDESPVQPRAIPPDVKIACDSAAIDVRAALGSDAKREDGTFNDSFQSTLRIGCRLSASGSQRALSMPGALAMVERQFGRRGWAQDLRFAADGPNGSDIGMRRRDLLCLIMDREAGDDDDDTTAARAAARAAAADRFDLIVECARDIPSNANAGVPDSLWQIAAALGIDSAYAIDERLQYPPYLTGDFDGDGVSDAAVLVTDRKTGRLGVLFVLRGPKRAEIIGAGLPPQGGPDDISWIDRWSVYPRDATFDRNINDHPGVPLRGDALWVAHGDSATAFLVWRDGGFVWDRRRPGGQ